MASGEDRYRLDEMVPGAPIIETEIGRPVRVDPRTHETVSESDSLHVREIADIILRYRKEVVAVFAVVVLLTILVSLFQRKVYRSEAILRYEQPAAGIAAGPYFSGGKPSVLSKFFEIPKIQLQRVKAREIALGRIGFYENVFSEDRAENVEMWRRALAIHERDGDEGLVTQLNLDPRKVSLVRGADPFHATWLSWLESRTPEQFEEAVGDGGTYRNVEIARRQSDKNMLDIRYDGPEPEVLPCIVNSMVLTMMNFEVDSKREKEDRAAQSMSRSLQTKRERLKTLEEEVRRLARSKGLLREDETILSSVVELERTYKLLHSRALDVEQDLEASRLALDEKETEIEETPREAKIPIYDNKTATDLQEKRRELSRLRIDLREKHPEILELKKEIELLEEQLKNEAEGAGVPVSIQVVTNPAYETLNQEIIRLRSRITMLEGKAGSLDRQMADIERQIMNQSPTTELRIKNDKITQLREQIQVMQKNIALREFEKSTATSHLEILSPALRPVDPIGPNRPKNLILGVLVGLVLAVATAFALDYVDTTLHSEVDIGRFFKLECLGVVPEAKVPGEEYIDLDNMNATLVEKFEMIKHHLESGRGRLPSSLLLTSAVQNEGKSTVSLNLAVSIANEGKRVLLINMDFRKETRHPMESMYIDPDSIVEGLSGYADSELSAEEVIYRTLLPNLFYMPAGLMVNNPSRLFRSERIWSLLDHVRERVDVMIIDGPAMSSFVDGYLIAQKVDEVVFICADDITPISMATRCVDKLKKFDIPIAGAILNRSKDKAAGEYGYYGYSGKG